MQTQRIEGALLQKPEQVALFQRLVLSMTDPNDAVFDPYMGVGSSVIAALMHDRIAYGCDIVPEYVHIAHERVRQLRTGELRTRPMGKPVYDPTLPNGGHWRREMVELGCNK